MSMTLPERRLWLAAADALPGQAVATNAVPAPGPAIGAVSGVTAPASPAPAAGVPGEPRLTTEEERRARLYQLLQDYRKEREGT